MRYCVSSRQPDELLKKADEIKVQARDINQLYDLIENKELVDKTFILEIPRDEQKKIDWSIIKAFESQHPNFLCAVQSRMEIKECINNGLKWYYDYPIATYFELNALKELEASYVILSMPLIFDLDTVNLFGMRYRAIPNIAFEDYLPQRVGVCGQWIRPEDTNLYESYIDVFEFRSDSLEQEAALYHIYAENKNWPGDLGKLIAGLGVSVDNRGLEDSIGARRLNCKQRCQYGKCHICQNAFLLGISLENKIKEGE